MRRNPLILGATVVAVLAAMVWRHQQRRVRDEMAVGGSTTEVRSFAELPRLLELGSDICVTCKAMVPVLDELRTAHADDLRVDFIDVYDNPDQADAYDVQIIPTQLFLSSSGEELARHEGFYGVDAIRDRWRSLGYAFDSDEPDR